mmetsp:Transcript_1214/g.2627  ORF Transcript_1214/g.2627 Transcript_1214/m.2627 type:complete len:213 (+) Transcript_1214:429-1067(+)
MRCRSHCSDPTAACLTEALGTASREGHWRLVKMCVVHCPTKEHELADHPPNPTFCTFSAERLRDCRKVEKLELQACEPEKHSLSLSLSMLCPWSAAAWPRAALSGRSLLSSSYSSSLLHSLEFLLLSKSRMLPSSPTSNTPSSISSSFRLPSSARLRKSASCFSDMTSSTDPNARARCVSEEGEPPTHNQTKSTIETQACQTWQAACLLQPR